MNYDFLETTSSKRRLMNTYTWNRDDEMFKFIAICEQ